MWILKFSYICHRQMINIKKTNKENKMETKEMIQTIGYKNIIKIAKKLSIDLNPNGRLIRKSDMRKIMTYHNQENTIKANLNNPNYDATKSRRNFVVSDICQTNNIEIGEFLIIGQSLDINLRRANSKVTREEMEKIIQRYLKYKNPQQYHSKIEKLLQEKYMIFLDSSILMKKNNKIIFQNELIPALQKYKQKVYIVESVLKKINKLISSKNLVKANQAKQAKEILDNLAQSNLCYYVDTHISKNKQSSEFISLFSRQITTSNLCFITDLKKSKRDKIIKKVLQFQTDSNTQTNFKLKVIYFKNSQFKIDKKEN